MNKVERILNTFLRVNIDFLPSQITFADRTRNPEIAKGLGLSNAEDLDEYLENHLDFLFLKYDKPLFLRNDIELMRKLEAEGIVGLDEDNKIVYDIWGMGIKIGEEGFYFCYSPFQGNHEANKKAKPFLPGDFNLDLLDMPPEQAVKEFIAPDPLQKNNFELLMQEAEVIKDNILPIPSGYFGIWERTNGMLGLRENLMLSLTSPEVVLEMYEKITDYKIKVARELIRLGFTVCHHGDDLAFQTSSFFSVDLYKKLLFPYHKKLFQVYRDAGVNLLYHSCGNITPFIPHLIEAGITALEPIQPCMDLNYLKKNFGEELIFMGGIDTQDILPFGTPEDVKKHTKEVICALGKNGGYIIAPAQEIMKDVPIENIVALIDTIKKERHNF